MKSMTTMLGCALLFCLGVTTRLANANDYLVGIPTVPFTSTGDSINTTSITSIVINSVSANATDDDGWTEIPPTLGEFAQIFADDWKKITGCSVPVHLLDGADLRAAEQDSTAIIIAVNQSLAGSVDAAGRPTSEGYTIEVNSSTGVKVTGASALGAWWGTRTLLQQAILGECIVATGSGLDAPGWNTRGVMLDGGRHFYPIDFLEELCSWLSFWKMNTLHLHLSDNLYNNVEIYSLERQMTLYSTFRLWTEDPALAGLNKRQNESYTQDQFEHLQASCAARGVTVIPDIEAPGHALVFTQWKPELGMEGQIDLLNLSNPDSTEQMKIVWKTFLPWFHSKVVHIGADEYVDSQLSKTALAEVYNVFVNDMADFIAGESGKTIRIWGTFPPNSNYSTQINKNVTLQHWEFFEDNPLIDYIDNEISVINSDDTYYIVTKYSTSYPQVLNKTRIFHSDHSTKGAWAPNIFDINNATNNPARNSPYVPGALAAQWNDYGPNTSTFLEAYQSWRSYLPALADKQWGGSLNETEYTQIYETLQKEAPGQNLDRNVPSVGPTILEYATFAVPNGKVVDVSGNSYDATTNCSVAADGTVWIAGGCTVTTPLTSKGNDYTLAMTFKQTSSSPGPILTGPDSALWSGNGTSTQLMLYSAGNAWALNYSLPVDSWVDGALIARGNRTYFQIVGADTMEFLADVGVNGERHEWAPLQVVAPLAMVGGGVWEAQMKNLKLVNYSA